jgi:Ca-activated chloride channel family protein
MSFGGTWRFTLLGYQLAFARPLYLLLALAAVAVAIIALIAASRRARRIGALVPSRLIDRLAPGISAGRSFAQSILYGLGLLLFAVALGQPQCASRSELVKRRGIDVIVALDASKSMLARDIAPSRLERAKLELSTLLDELKGDRVGLVVFAGDAFIQCPLTSDYSAAKLFLRAVDPEQMPQGGTNIGAALALSQRMIENADRGAKERVVVLISDGEDLGGDVDEAMSALRDNNIRVLAVGIGSEEGEPIPVFNRRGEVVGHKKDESGQVVLTRLNREGLSRIAEGTGGRFFYQPQSVAMNEVVGLIDSMQKSELEDRLMVHYGEGYQYFAFPGLMLLAGGMLLHTSRRRASA